MSEDDAPDADELESNYGGRTKETKGILAILTQIKEDLEDEVNTSTSAEAKALDTFEKSSGKALSII